MDRATREVWTKRIERWKESGLSAKEFAAELGIKSRTLTWWRWNLATAPTRKLLRNRSTSGAAKSIAITKPASASISPLTFVEMAAPVSTEALEVVLPTSLRIRVRPGFDDTTLSRLLDVLERR